MDTEQNIFDIDDLKGCWPWYSFMGCRPCGIRLAPFAATVPMCPKCGKHMHIFQVTEEEFAKWLEHQSRKLALVARKPPKPDFDELIRRAEHEISYRAKRAIEMYIPVWEKEPAYYLFLKCAEAHVLCRGEIEKCRYLMREYGMVEVGMSGV